MAAYLYTSELARAVGVHPNTVRRYVARGLLPPVERSPAGYRRFTPRHLDCLRVTTLVYHGVYPGRAIFLSGARIVRAVVADDLDGARELAQRHLALVRAEQTQADLAAALLERWASQAGAAPQATPATPALRIGQVARLLGVSSDMARVGPQRPD